MKIELIKYTALIVVFTGMILLSCNSEKDRQENYSVIKLLEGENPYDSSNCYSYVLIDGSQDSISIKKALPALKKSIAAGSKKNCRTLTIIFLTPERHRKAIHESGYTDFAHSGKFPDNFTYYDDHNIGKFRMDENLKQLIQTKTIQLPEDTIGVWDDSNWAIVLFERENRRYAIKYLPDGRENVNRRTELKTVLRDGQTFYRCYFLNDYFGPDSMEYRINEFGDLETYTCFGYFRHLSPRVTLKN